MDSGLEAPLLQPADRTYAAEIAEHPDLEAGARVQHADRCIGAESPAQQDPEGRSVQVHHDLEAGARALSDHEESQEEPEPSPAAAHGHAANAVDPAAAVPQAQPVPVPPRPGGEAEPPREPVQPSGAQAAALHQIRKETVKLCCARVTCVWSVKLAFVVLFTQLILLVGPLSEPIWIPISLDAGCEQNNDVDPKPVPFTHIEDMADVRSCQKACTNIPECQAVDFYNATRWCNLYSAACMAPTATWDGACSFQIASACAVRNGSTGILIGGKCDLALQMPSTTSMMREEVPRMLSSPSNWFWTSFCVCIYLYLSLDWPRSEVNERCKCLNDLYEPVEYVCGTILFRAIFLLALFFVWISLTEHFFGPALLLACVEPIFQVSGFRPVPKPVREAANAASRFPVTAWMWLLVSLIVFLALLVPKIGSFVSTAAQQTGSCLMSIFNNIISCLCCEGLVYKEACACIANDCPQHQKVRRICNGAWLEKEERERLCYRCQQTGPTVRSCSDGCDVHMCRACIEDQKHAWRRRLAANAADTAVGGDLMVTADYAVGGTALVEATVTVSAADAALAASAAAAAASADTIGHCPIA